MHFSFAEIIHPPHRCGISRCWLDSMIIAQVWLRLVTIKGHSKMCSFITQHNATDVASFKGVCNWPLGKPLPSNPSSQWQLSISCTGSGTQKSLGFSAIEKHWKIQNLHRFYGVDASKMEKRCAWGTFNTDSRYPERMGNIIYFIKFPESKQNRAKCP